MWKFLAIFLMFVTNTWAAASSSGMDVRPFRKFNRFIMVTGCGRSGTGYMTEFLQRSGLNVKHESMGKDGIVSWLMAADGDRAPWGPLSKYFTFQHVFHQIRNPLKVIQSYYNVPPDATWRWINEIIPEISLNDPPLVKCAKYWYYWNLLAESKAEWSFRIEDFDTKYAEMGERLGMVFDQNILRAIPKDTNTKGMPKKTITWTILRDELDRDLYGKIAQLAYRYGYPIHD